jgi:hypothetical protein
MEEDMLLLIYFWWDWIIINGHGERAQGREVRREGEKREEEPGEEKKKEHFMIE